ncbi:hypothetical protein Q31b_06280 [Novipirellula aureliae]|uniref:Uncharacterized protein n=1 Tax=Novipirellula aureliae TaxID=2527966 RepID=A0A5C6ED19_9BACT|nr:hypothetical protein [Novipirellula aureliae]TWU45456.1 hypothetical protein Q31b_06280 [Novipirellula aureliae]
MLKNRLEPEIDDNIESSLAEQLTWDLLDGQISEPGMQQLEELIEADEESRRCYIACLDLDQMLSEYFQQPSAVKEQSTPTTRPFGGVPLGSLMSDAPRV